MKGRGIVAGLCLFFAVVILGTMFSCTGLTIPGALNVQVFREEEAVRTVSETDPAGAYTRAPGDDMYRISPDNAVIAFTRIWYPTKDTAEAILSDPENTRMSDFTDIADPESYASGCLTVLDREPDNALVFNLEDSDFKLESDILPEPDTCYPGVIIETLYYEFTINDFTIRWYTMGDGTYARKDILIKTDASVTGGTGGEYKFAYVSNNTGAVEFFDERQTTGNDDAGYSSLIRDEIWSDWDNGGTTGLLPSGTHFVLHNEIETMNRFNSLFYGSGNAPEVIDYVIRYNLSVEYGGVEYAEAADADSDGDITFSDLSDDSGPRVLDLTPITGAIEYNW